MTVMFKRVRIQDGSIPEYEWHEADYVNAWQNLSYEWMTLEDYLKSCYQDVFCNSFHMTQPHEYLTQLSEAIQEGIILMQMDFGPEFKENYKKLEMLDE